MRANLVSIVWMMVIVTANGVEGSTPPGYFDEFDFDQLMASSDSVALLSPADDDGLGVRRADLEGDSDRMEVNVAAVIAGESLPRVIHLKLTPLSPRFGGGNISPSYQYLAFLRRAKSENAWCVTSAYGVMRLSRDVTGTAAEHSGGEARTRDPKEWVAGALTTSLNAADPELRIAALRSLAAIGAGLRAWPKARALAGDEDPRVAAAAMLFRLQTGDAVDFRRLLDELESGRFGPDVSELAMYGIELNSALNTDDLVRVLESSSGALRLAALRALTEMGDERSVPALAHALRDPEEENRKQAHLALAVITQRDVPGWERYKRTVSDAAFDWSAWLEMAKEKWGGYRMPVSARRQR